MQRASPRAACPVAHHFAIAPALRIVRELERFAAAARPAGMARHVDEPALGVPPVRPAPSIDRIKGLVDGTAVLGTIRRPLPPRHSAGNQRVTEFLPERRAGPETWVGANTPANRPRRPPRPGFAQAPRAAARLGGGRPRGAAPAPPPRMTRLPGSPRSPRGPRPSRSAAAARRSAGTPARRRRTPAASAPPTPSGAGLPPMRPAPRNTSSPPPAARRRPPPARASRSAAPACRDRAPRLIRGRA
jgi:hypothetical protein